MKTNEAFSMSDDGRICVGDVHTDSGPRGRCIETISSIPAFIKTIQNDPNCFVEHVHKSFLPRQTRKVAPAGRKADWVRWISKSDQIEYMLKSDYTVRARDKFHIDMRLPPTTDVFKFIDDVAQQGHMVTYVHPQFQRRKRTKVNA